MRLVPCAVQLFALLLFMNYAEFQKKVNLSQQNICRELFAHNRTSIRVKKEKTVVRNLEKIFSAVLAISNVKGFQAMSMRDLSRKTRLSTGALYSYFSSKEELLAMLQTQRRTLTKRVLEEHIRREKDPWGKLRVAIQAHLYLSEAMQSWFYFSFMEAKHLSQKELKMAVASELYTEQMIADILEQGRAAGLFNVDDCLLTASLVKAMLQDWYLKRSKYAKRNIAVGQYARFMLGFLEAYLLKR